MKCIIVGIKPVDYKKKGTEEQVKGVSLYMLADNIDVYGKVFKDCFIAADTPLYKQNESRLEDMNELLGREVNAEWDVETYVSKQIKRLISFEFCTYYYDICKRESAAD